MTTISGVFPNAITPTFAPSEDPANQLRLRRENEAAVFAPVDEVSATAGSRAALISQPGRLASEQALASATALADGTGAGGFTETQSKPSRDSAEAVSVDSRDKAVRQESRMEDASRQAENDRIKLAGDVDLVRELASLDREVRAHEQAHKSVGGQHTGTMAFTFEFGPDGKRYAVGGEVPIDVGRVAGDPEATLHKAQQVHLAALAPAEPSIQDRRVAVLASQLVVEAQGEIRQVERDQSTKAAEERSEQSDLNKEDAAKTEANSAQVDDGVARTGSDNERRPLDVFNEISQAGKLVAQTAAYMSQQKQAVGFNLDTTV
ncbi:MAG: hypothetical protein ACI9RY_000593 [Reinekea sp.]|jgi:hypothetical protein